MDTLVIVRKIREAETLADGGNHAEAMRLLEPLLGHDGLDDSHRALIRKKLELLDRQRQRITRIMERSRQEREDGEPTVISLAREDRTERPTETAIETQSEGDPTEAVPRVNDRAQTRKRAAGRGGIEAPPTAEVSDTQQVPRPAALPARRPALFDPVVEPEDEAILARDDSEVIEDFTPIPTRADLAASGQHRALGEPVVDSLVMPTPAPGPPPGMKHETEDFTGSDRHFGPPPASRKNTKSTGDLKALAEELPDNDMRRDLALEVVRLREELSKSKRRPRTEGASRPEGPASGKFHIPAGQANTIVRRAAGSESIEVHMPSRDENMPELQVLRRDSVSGRRPGDTASPTESAARSYVEGPSNRARAFRLRPVLMAAGALALLALIALPVFVVWKALTAPPQTALVTETGVGGIELGAEISTISGLSDAGEGTHLSATGWIVQSAQGMVTAITVKLGENANAPMVSFGNRSMNLGQGTAAATVAQSMGEGITPLDAEALKAASVYSLRYRDKHGRSVLEFVFTGGDETRAAALRLYSEADNPPLPDLAP